MEDHTPTTPKKNRRNVSRLRSIGGESACVPPNFNTTMLAIWEEIWHFMPQSGKVSATVGSMLQQYKQRCQLERALPRLPTQSPPALLPVSFAHAKDWLMKQQKVLSEPFKFWRCQRGKGGYNGPKQISPWQISLPRQLLY